MPAFVGRTRACVGLNVCLCMRAMVPSARAMTLTGRDQNMSGCMCVEIADLYAQWEWCGEGGQDMC